VRDPHERADAFVTGSRALISLTVRTIEDSPVDVTIAQHRVLVLLAAHGNLTIGEIAGGLGVNPSNATRYCDRLQRLGLVARTRSPADGRVVHVALTTAGGNLVRDVNDRRRAEVETVLDRMTSRESAGVLDALHAFNRAAREIENRNWASALW
jgi:DNA-binding MarR family transcriptional regulator